MKERTFNALRRELKARSVRNSFRGATYAFMARLLEDTKQNKCKVPPQLLTSEALRTTRTTEYTELLGKRSLEEIAQHLPDHLWEDYNKHGWLHFDLNLSKREKRMIALCHRVALCELVRREPYVSVTQGVIPS